MAADFWYEPIWGIVLSVITYQLAIYVQQRVPWLHPLFLCSGMIMLILLAADIPYDAYLVGGDILKLCLGPATIALGVPIYKHRALIRQHFWSVLLGVVLGSLSGIAVAGISVWLLNGAEDVLLSMLPKSVTTPISIEISRRVGGIAELTAVLTVLTGLIGAMFGRSFLHLLGVRHDVAIGVAMGTAAHGIGTASVLRTSTIQGGVGGLSMGIAGIMTALWFIPLSYYL